MLKNKVERDCTTLNMNIQACESSNEKKFREGSNGLGCLIVIEIVYIVGKMSCQRSYWKSFTLLRQWKLPNQWEIVGIIIICWYSCGLHLITIRRPLYKT